MESIPFGQRLKKSMVFPLYFLAIMWIVHLVQFISPFDFGFLGVYPLEWSGLKGIIFAPLVHGDWQHLISNSAPFFVLTTMIMLFYRKVAIRSFLMIYILTGLSVWLFARPVFHIGASGVVYGLLAFVFWSGIFRRNIKSIVLALIVTFLYSGFIVGILPNQPGISWESHLMGGLIGIFTAYWYKEEIEADEHREVPSWELEEPKEEEFFLPRDAFDRTKQEQLPGSNRDDRQSGGWFTNVS